MNTIKLKDYNKNQLELVADGVMTPGMLVELTSAGKVKKHATSEGNVLVMIALEDELQGKAITEDYADADQVQVWVPSRGDEVYGVLATNQVIVIGDFLASNGDGTFKKHVPIQADYPVADAATPILVQAIVGQAIEAKTTTSAVGRIMFRVI